MKGKLYVLLLVLVVLIAGVSVGVASANKHLIQMPSTIMSTQKLTLTSNEKLKENSVAKGWVYVTNEKGEKIDVSMKSRDEFTLEIEGLPVGTYNVYVDKKALAKARLFAKSQTFKMEVIDKLASIKSDEDLLKYFEAVQKKHEQASPTRLFGVDKAEESANMDMASGSGSGNSHSTTNNQVEGIEEADSTVTDGETIYTIGMQKVHLIDAKNPTQLKVQSTIPFKENQYVEQLLLHDKYLLVVYGEYNERYENEQYFSDSYSKIAIYDVTNKEAPKLVREFGHEGNMIAIRKINQYVYLVSQSAPDYWHILKAEDLKPSIYDSELDEAVPIENKNISILPGAMEPTYTTISVIDLTNGVANSIETESYLGSSRGFYMSHEAMYITVEKYSQPSASNRMMIDMIQHPSETTIYRFAIDGQNVQFVGQAFIAGGILNQFSMDEHNGYFRVAITSGNTRGPEANSTSAIHIFDGQMNEVGKVSDLAKGERIYSARFMGDRAYIVTFRETDPLFTFDLSEPTKPKVLGELKIPGFSTYLHPIGEHHLLGLGLETSLQKIEGTNETFVQQEGVKLSLFNVEDLRNPYEQDVVVIGGQGSYSPAIDSHKAFFIHPGKNYYGFPIALYNYRNERNPFYGQGAMLYKVTPEDGIELAADLVERMAQNYEMWEDMPQRLVYSGNTLFLVSWGSVKSYDLTTFEELNKIYFK